MAALQPVTFLVPASSAEPVTLDVVHSGLRMVLVNRESIHLLGDEWKVLGIYFLLGPSEDDPDRYRAYVGEVGKSSLVQRAKHHAKQKAWWNRALLVGSNSIGGFNSAEIGWLEGRLYDVLNNAVSCEVMNGNRPGDDSLPSHQRDVLERYVDPIMAALRACGASPDTPDQKPEPKGKKKVTFYPETVADLLGAGLLKPDTVLRSLKLGVIGSARVLADGRVEVSGHVHSSLSGAARAVTGAIAESGWDFWGAPSGDGGFVALSKLRERLRESESKKTSGESPAAAPIAKPEAPAPSATSGGDASGLAELVASAGLALPLRMWAKYRGQVAHAVIADDGVVVFDGRRFRSPSTAGSAARIAFGYAGARTKPATNGWTWWCYTDAEGVERQLDHLRRATRSFPTKPPTT